jgi:hypothetical protein
VGFFLSVIWVKKDKKIAASVAAIIKIKNNQNQ